MEVELGFFLFAINQSLDARAGRLAARAFRRIVVYSARLALASQINAHLLNYFHACINSQQKQG